MDPPAIPGTQTDGRTDMAKFMIMQWDWTGPVVFRTDGMEALQPACAEDEQPAHSPRPTRITGAVAARFDARGRRGD
jgi:hypothetical protein